MIGTARAVCLAAGADVNAKMGDGVRPLHMCIWGGGDYTEMLELILSAGAEVNAVNEKNTTALHLAARFNSRKKVALLLAAGADVHVVHSKGETALSEAVDYHHGPESVRLLLAAGADPNQSRPNGHSLLHIASQYADVEVAAALIAGGADVSARNRWGLYPPLSLCPDASIAAQLRAAGAILPDESTSTYDETPEGALFRHISNGDLPRVQASLEAGAVQAAIDLCIFSPVCLAIKWNRTEIIRLLVELLLSYGADPLQESAGVGSPLQEAEENAEENEYADLIPLLRRAARLRRK